MLVKTVVVQSRIGQRLSLEEKIHIFKQQPDFVCLPEYIFVDGDTPDLASDARRRSEHLQYLTRLSADLGTCLIGGSVIEQEGDRFYNTSYLINRGNVLGHYRKRHPVDGEAAGGISAGAETVSFDIEGVEVGLMICGDVFYPEMYAEMAERSVDVLFIPTTSAYRPDDTPARKRDRDLRYFVEGARTSGAYVAKACGIGALYGKPLQGRSLIAAPWDVMARIDPDFELEPRTLTVTLDIDELRDFRRKHRRRNGSFAASR